MTPAPPPTDTVEIAATTPDHPQPFRELGLKDDEYLRIREILGRRPTDAELAMYSVMWSEHCSYKSSKVHLRYFGETTTAAMKERMLAGIGENAGVVEIGDGWAVTFKVESHNHPSYVEPYQGAATGVGGIVRDIMAMGARPIAVADPLRFGPADAPDTARVLPGVVAGVGGYGNCLGLPNVGGEVVFDPTYAGNPLVNALCVGVDAGGGPAPGVRLRHRQQDHPVRRADRSRRHRRGLRAGQRDVQRRRLRHRAARSCPSVQVGDPFTEKVLIECCLELFAAGLVVGIQDLGGAGLSCATSELASAGDGGMHIELDRVPLRATGMTPAEILSSESQERMCAVVTPENVDAFLAVCAKWDTLATVIGEVTDGDRLVITWHGETVVDVPPRTVAHDGPVYERPVARSERPGRAGRGRAGPAAPARGPVRAARGDPADGGVAEPVQPRVGHRSVRPLRPRQHRVRPARRRRDRPGGRGDRARHRRRDRLQRPLRRARPVPRHPARARRGVPQRRDVRRRAAGRDELPQLRLAGRPARHVAVRRGGARARRRLRGAGHPGDRRQRQLLQPDRLDGDPADAGGRACSACSTTSRAGSAAGSCATATPCCCSGRRATSSPAASGPHVVHGHLGGRPPQVDLAAEQRLAGLLAAAAADGLLTGSHDLSDGGLAQALVEACLVGGRGATVALPRLLDPFVALFAESAGRVLVTVDPADVDAVGARAKAAGVPAERLGSTGGATLEIADVGTLDLDAVARGLGGHPAGAVRRRVRGGRATRRPGDVRKATFSDDDVA